MTIDRQQDTPKLHSNQHGDEIERSERHDPDDQWECESSCSGTSTGAVVSDNRPPLGYRVREQTRDESSPDGDFEELCPEENPVPAESTRRHTPQGEADGPQTPNTPQLSPLEGPYILRHPTILTPGAVSRRDGYGDEYHTVLTEIDIYERPSTRHSVEPESFTPCSASEFSEPIDQQSSEFETYRPLQQIIADGVGFDLISPPVYAPSPITAPVHTAVSTPTVLPSPIHGRSRSTSTSSRTPRSRSPSPAYGAWISDRPRPKRPSFLDRAQAHFERSIHEHLVKAGQRPLPSFKVLGVEKSVKKNVSVCEDGGDESAHVPFPAMSPSHTEADWRERMEGLVQARGRVHERRSRTLSPKRWAEEQGADERWKFGEEKEVETENPHATAPAYMTRYITSMTEKHSLAGLHIDTRLKPLPPPPGVAELETPRDHDHSPTPNLTQSPEPSCPCLHVGAQVDDVKIYDSTPSSWSALESLSPDPGKGGNMHYRENTYKGREREIQHRRRQRQQQKQHPVTDPRQLASRSRPPLRLGFEYERRPGVEVVRTNRLPAPLSRDQLGFASLPSPLEDLFRPFPFDNRLNLPSQTTGQGDLVTAARPRPCFEGKGRRSL